MSFLPPKEAPSEDTIRANYASLFTMQERETVADLLSRGKIDFVGAALEVENPERAYWLDKYLMLKRPKAEEMESAVQEEIRKWQGEGNEIDTPVKAAFWDNRMQIERSGQKLPDVKKALEDFALSNKTADNTSVEEDDGKSMSKVEIMAALDAKNIAYKPIMKKAELKALLEQSESEPSA